MRWLDVAVALAAIGCSQPVNEHASPPTSGSYQITFPSTAVAVASDTVEVLVFDATDPAGMQTGCPTLIAARKSGAPLPKQPVLLHDSGALRTCDLASGGKGVVEVSFGPRTLLAVSQRAGQDYFLGCASQQVSESASSVNLTLAQAVEGTVVPPTTCTALSQKCAGMCQ
jgi:hypothetical protein